MIENIHKKNLELIKKKDIKIGTDFILQMDTQRFMKGKSFRVETITKHFGWILFDKTEQLPQEAEQLLKIGKFNNKSLILDGLK